MSGQVLGTTQQGINTPGRALLEGPGPPSLSPPASYARLPAQEAAVLIALLKVPVRDDAATMLMPFNCQPRSQQEWQPLQLWSAFLY